MSAREFIERVEALAANATPGVWKLWGMQVLADQDGTSNVATAVPVADTRMVIDGKPRTFDAQFIAASRTVVPQLTAALRAVLDLHRAVPRYFVGDDENLFESAEDCAAWHGVQTDDDVLIESLTVCSHCRSIEAGMCEEPHDYDPDATYYPCPTVRAITDALGGEQA